MKMISRKPINRELINPLGFRDKLWYSLHKSSRLNLDLWQRIWRQIPLQLKTLGKL